MTDVLVPVLLDDSGQGGSGSTMVYAPATLDANRVLGINGGSRLFNYILTSDGTTVSAYDKNGSLVTSSTDGGAVLAAVLPAAGAAGASIVFRNDGNVFPWSTVPALPKGITNRLVINGNGATVRLSTAGPRFLDFNKTADHDTFQNIEITDFVVDANSIQPSGQTQHVILGTWPNGSLQTRINFDEIKVRRCRAINVPVATSGNYRLGCVLQIAQVSGGEGTLNYATNILFEDVRVDGGNYGCAVFGSPGSLAGNGNMLVDNVVIQRCKHSLLSAPSGAFTAANFHVGGQAKGGRCVVRDCEGYFSSDVGVEIDSMTDALVENVKIEDAFNENFYFTNQTAPITVAEARITWRHCESRSTNVDTANGWLANNTSGIALGAMVIEDCSHYANRANPITGISVQAVQFGSLTVRDFRGVQEGIAYSSASNTFPRMIKVKPATTTAYIRLERIFCRIAGARSGSGTYNYVAINIDGLAIIDLDHIEIEDVMTGLSSNTTNALGVGTASGAVIRGRIRGLVCGPLGDDANPKAVSIAGSSTLTTAGILCEENDFSTMTAGGEFSIGDATNKALIRVRANTWRVKPAPVALTGLVTATGKAPATMWDCLVVFTQGSGAAITAIDFSTDGGTTYTNFLTQASAALPAGFDQTLGPVTTDALIKATFTTTQPTITLVPVNP